MENKPAASEFLVISRGKWDENLPPERIEKAIEDFYIWLEEMVAAGKMKRGQRLATGGKTVSKSGILDGPFGETKEIIGGYWFIVAADLDEAAALASRNPCMQCGLFYEIRPVDPERASAYVRTNETPEGRAA
jgi:hypothetical protein